MDDIIPSNNFPQRYYSLATIYLPGVIAIDLSYLEARELLKSQASTIRKVLKRYTSNSNREHVVVDQSFADNKLLLNFSRRVIPHDIAAELCTRAAAHHLQNCRCGDFICGRAACVLCHEAGCSN